MRELMQLLMIAQLIIAGGVLILTAIAGVQPGKEDVYYLCIFVYMILCVFVFLINPLLRELLGLSDWWERKRK